MKANFSLPINPKNLMGKKYPPVILADPTYPLLPWLMKGFDAKGDLSRKERLFNYRLSRTRSNDGREHFWQMEKSVY